MKLNKKRKDARLPNWLLEVLGTLQIKYQWTFTEALIRTAEKGSVYYNKQWEKMHGKDFPGDKKPKEAKNNDERCPNDHHENDKPQMPEREIPDIMVDLMLVLYYDAKDEEIHKKYVEEIQKPLEFGMIDNEEVIKRCNQIIKEHHLEDYIKKLKKQREQKRKAE